jgi:hypothetical protein
MKRSGFVFLITIHPNIYVSEWRDSYSHRWKCACGRVSDVEKTTPTQAAILRDDTEINRRNSEYYLFLQKTVEYESRLSVMNFEMCLLI